MAKPAAAAARRALDGHRADPRRPHLRDDRGDQPRRARRSCSSSRTRTTRSASPTRGYVLETGTVALSDDVRGAPREPRGPEGVPRHMIAIVFALLGAKALYLLYVWLRRRSSPPTCPSARATARSRASRRACCSAVMGPISGCSSRRARARRGSATARSGGPRPTRRPRTPDPAGAGRRAAQAVACPPHARRRAHARHRRARLRPGPAARARPPACWPRSWPATPPRRRSRRC